MAADKDAVIGKLTDDLIKVNAELARVNRQLMKAQDAVALLQPLADPVIALRERQAAWDAEHEACLKMNALARIAPLRKLGPRPTLTIT